MRSLTESPAVLTVHEGAAGQFIIRVADMKYRPLVVEVTKLLPDAQSFVVITPSDIKIFRVSTNGSGKAATVAAQVDDPEMSAAIDEEANAEGSDTLPPSEGEEVEQDTELAPPPRTRKRKRPESIAGHPGTCGRCGGTGKIQSLADGGQPIEAPCHLCKGAGEVTRYGARR